MAAAATRYTDPRAHELRERYLATYGGNEVPVPVESIAEDLLGLRIEATAHRALRQDAGRSRENAPVPTPAQDSDLAAYLGELAPEALVRRLLDVARRHDDVRFALESEAQVAAGRFEWLRRSRS